MFTWSAEEDLFEKGTDKRRPQPREALSLESTGKENFRTEGRQVEMPETGTHLAALPMNHGGSIRSPVPGSWLTALLS